MKQADKQNKDALLADVVGLIRSSSRFAVFSHEEPDGDAIGSQVAISAALKQLGKGVLSLRTDPVPPALDFLNPDNLIREYVPSEDDAAIRGAETIIVVDSSDLFRLGDLAGVAKDSPAAILNIDHHRDNTFFGDVNYVRWSAGGAAELIYEVVRALEVPVEGRIAQGIYVGLSTDTVGFRYIDPEGNMLEVIRDLIRGGIDIENLQEKIYCNQPDTYLEDLSSLQRTVNYENGGSLAWFTMFKSDYLSFYQRELASETLRQLLSVKRTRAAVMLHEEKAGVEVWLRSKKDVDVGRAALAVGGGGHHTAAGALIRGKSLEEATAVTLAAVREEMGK